MEYFIKHNRLHQKTKDKLLQLLKSKDQEWIIRKLTPDKDDTPYEIALYNFITDQDHQDD